MLFYIIDTNVLVDYPDIIPDENSKAPENPTIDLNNAHIVIPSAVIRELSSFKKERSDRGRAARIVLKRVRKIVEEISAESTVYDSYSVLEHIIDSKHSCSISVVPVHKNFKQCLPYLPSEDDMDGQIILTALSVAFTLGGLPVDGTAAEKSVAAFIPKDVILLTNDNGLATRAYERGIKTLRYSHKVPPVYTGRRDLTVPSELFEMLIDEHLIPLDVWRKFLPEEPELNANEFVILRSDDPSAARNYDQDNDPYFSYIGRYDSKMEAIVSLKYATSFPIGVKNPGQAIYAEALMDPDIDVVICTGPAGSGKTYMATVYALEACRNGNFIGTTVIPCQIENDGVGYLPGDLEEKLDPNVQPIKNAIRNFLLENDKDIKKQLNAMLKFGAAEQKPSRDSNSQSQKSLKSRLEDLVDLTWENWFSAMAICYARGRDFSHEIAFYDEFQDQTRVQADTLLKRLGKNGKIIITGDIEQIHSAYLDRDNNGLTYARNLAKNAPMVAQVTFTEDEIVRSPFVKMLAQRQAK